MAELDDAMQQQEAATAVRLPVRLPYRLPRHIVVSAEEVENPALRRLLLCCDRCGGEEEWLVDADRELYWTAGRFLDRHYACPMEDETV